MIVERLDLKETKFEVDDVNQEEGNLEVKLEVQLNEYLVFELYYNRVVVKAEVKLKIEKDY